MEWLQLYRVVLLHRRVRSKVNEGCRILVSSAAHIYLSPSVAWYRATRSKVTQNAPPSIMDVVTSPQFRSLLACGPGSD